MAESINVQHVNVKIVAEEPVSIDLADAIPVFHRWIQESVGEEMLVDVADYRHVPAGPGVMLIGHEANYSLDYTDDRLGLLYNRKRVIDGTTQQKLDQAFRAALLACRRLEEEAPFHGKLKFNAGHCEIILNDRLLAPNTEKTHLALKADFEKFFQGVFGLEPHTIERLGEPRERFRVEVKSRRSLDVRLLLDTPQPV
jgi:hypothetical protein